MPKKGEHSGTKKVRPPKPKISLSDIRFLIVLEIKGHMTGLVERGKELKLGSNDPFQIIIENLSYLGVSKSDLNDVKIKCEVSYKRDPENSVKLFEARKSLDRNLGWLINIDLRAPHGLSEGGLVADVKVSFNVNVLDKISLEFCIESDKRYYSVDDTLRYLQWTFPKTI